jgi:hypothetical protein
MQGQRPAGMGACINGFNYGNRDHGEVQCVSQKLTKKYLPNPYKSFTNNCTLSHSSHRSCCCGLIFGSDIGFDPGSTVLIQAKNDSQHQKMPENTEGLRQTTLAEVRWCRHISENSTHYLMNLLNRQIIKKTGLH